MQTEIKLIQNKYEEKIKLC